MATRKRLDADTVEIVAKDATTAAFEVKVSGDSFPRFRVTGDGVVKTGAGTAEPATTLGASAGGATAVTVYKKTITVGGAYSAAQLAAGITLFTPAVGDYIANVAPVVTTTFDGTTPKLDVGPFNPSTAGLYYDTTSVVFLGNNATEQDGWLSPVLDLAAASAYGGYGGPWVTNALPFKVVISQDGAKGGTPIDSTVGTVVVYVVVHPAASMVDLDA